MQIRCCWLFALLLGWCPNLVADILYSVTDLGGSYSYAYSLNNAGQVTGWSDANGGQHAFLYSNGQMTDLGTLPGDSSSIGYGINNLGQVVGASTAGDDMGGGFSRAFLYTNGQMKDLGTLGSGLSSASGINDAGQVTGRSTRPQMLNTPFSTATANLRTSAPWAAD